MFMGLVSPITRRLLDSGLGFCLVRFELSLHLAMAESEVISALLLLAILYAPIAPVTPVAHLVSAKDLPSEANSLDSSSFGSDSSALHFDNFVLFGQIHSYEEYRKMKGCKLQLSVEVGENVWLQSLKSKHYAFQLPTSIYSGMVGTISIVVRDENKRGIWNHSFVVQDDVGAHRLDADIEAAIDSIKLQAETIGEEGSDSSGVTKIKGKRNHGGQLALMYHHDTTFLICTPWEWQERSCLIRKISEEVVNFSEEGAMHSENKFQIPMIYEANSLESSSPVGPANMQQRGGWELEKVYSWQLIVHPIRLQTWHIACLLASFAIIRSMIGLLKSIELLEVAVSTRSPNPVGELPRLCDTNIASWQLCLNDPAPIRSLRGHSSHFKDREEMTYSGEGCFQEAWYDAERHLSKVIDTSCQGAYFSYNCVSGIPSRDKQDSTPGRWNRDDAGRLIRQLWSVNH